MRRDLKSFQSPAISKSQIFCAPGSSSPSITTRIPPPPPPPSANPNSNNHLPTDSQLSSTRQSPLCSGNQAAGEARNDARISVEFPPILIPYSLRCQC